LEYQWELPTIVLAFENEGSALAQAWEAGALAGWIWYQLPEKPTEALLKLMLNINVIKIVATYPLLQFYKKTASNPA
jgi:hypothetical protein